MVFYDPKLTTYEKLLKKFSSEHDVTQTPWKVQYKSGIWCVHVVLLLALSAHSAAVPRQVLQ